MKIAPMNERVTFQWLDETETDEYGNHRPVWKNYFTCSTYASTMTKDETEPAATMNEQRQITFQCRYCSELASVSSTSYRAIFHGEIYNIVAFDPMNYQRKTLHFKCVKAER